jgi:hypothetical protein
MRTASGLCSTHGQSGPNPHLEGTFVPVVDMVIADTVVESIGLEDSSGRTKEPLHEIVPT